MGDTLRDLYRDAPAGAVPVDFENPYADAPEGAVPVELTGTEEPLGGLQKALQDSPQAEDHRYNALAALVLAQETGVDPGKIYDAIDLYNELDSGTKQNPKGFFQRVWERLSGGYIAQAMVVPALKHMFGDRTPERWAQIQGMKQKLPAKEQAWAILPKPTQDRLKAEGMEKFFQPAPAESQPAPLAADVEEQAELQQAAEQHFMENPIISKNEAMRLFIEEMGLRHDPLALQFILEAANILPQLSIGLASNLAGMGIGGGIGYLTAGPAGAAKGAVIGGRALSYLQMSLAEAVPDYIELVEQGIDPNIAMPISLASGIAKAPIEFMQVSELFSPLLKGVMGKEVHDLLTSPIYKKATREATKRALRNVAARAVRQAAGAAKGFGPGLMKEAVWEEGAQGAIGFVMQELAIELNNATKGTQFEHNWQRFGPEITETITRAVMGFAPLQLLSSGAAGARAGTAAAKLAGEGAEAAPAEAEKAAGVEGVQAIPRSEKLRLLREEGLSEEDAGAVLEGTKTVRQAVDETLGRTLPLPDAETQLSHNDAWQQAHEVGYARVEDIMSIPEAGAEIEGQLPPEKRPAVSAESRPLIPPAMKEQAVAAMKATPASEGAPKQAAPEIPPATKEAILTLRTKDGKLHPDPKAADFLEVAENLGLDPLQIAESGRMVRGRYLDEGEYESWIKRGAKPEDLPEADAAERFFHAIKRAKPDLDDDTAYAIVALEEARAGAMGLTLEEDITRFYQREIVSTETPPESAWKQVDPEIQRRAIGLAVDAFGLTQDAGEAGFVLPDGTMLDFSGRREAKGVLRLVVEQMPEYVRGGRHLDHREIARVWQVSPEIEGQSFWAPVAQFQAASGAVRYDGHVGIASFVEQPTEEQLQAIVEGWRQNKVERVMVALSDEKGYDKASAEIPWPTVEKLKRFLAEARYAGTRAALYQGGPNETERQMEKLLKPEGLPLDPDSLSPAVLSLMDRKLRAKGYDVRGPQDVLGLIKGGRVWKDGVLWHPDWITVYEEAKASEEGRKARAAAKRAEKATYSNINWERIRELGLTGNLREAGYIRPDGMLIDLSGKRIGGQPGERALDRREAGGTEGMQEFVAYGNIRMDYNAGALDIGKEPTDKQYSVMARLIERKNGDVVLDLADGLGEYDKANYFYRQPPRTFYQQYPEGTKPSRVLNDIKRFFAGEDPVPLVEGRTMYQRTPKRDWLLHSEAIIQDKMKGPMPASQIKAMLLNNGVKADEMKWIGLEDFLRGEEKKTPAEVLAFIEQNDIKIEEVLRGAVKGESEYRAALTNARKRKQEAESFLNEARIKALQALEAAGMSQLDRINLVDRMVYYWDSDRGTEALGQAVQAVPSFAWEALHEDYAEYLEAAREVERLEGQIKPTEARYGRYTVPGGKNYRELLLTLPAYLPTHETEYYVHEKDGAILWAYSDKEKAETKAKEVGGTIEEVLAERRSRIPEEFRSSHWEERNVLLHVRFNERTDVQGRRLLFIEEIQSDWHQQGRELGYRDAAPESFVIESPEKPGWWMVRDDPTILFNSRDLAAKQAKKRASGLGVPGVPFSKTWHELAFKRMLRWATEEGFDAVAWTTGEQQAERYDLGKQVDGITIKKRADDSAWVIVGKKDGVDKVGVDVASLDKLSEYIGKDLAAKAQQDLAKTEDEYKGVTYSGVDLKVGGEGMKGFYDKILVDFANKYGKKWGAAVDTSKIRTGYGAWIITRPDGTEERTTSRERVNAISDSIRWPIRPDPAAHREEAVHALPVTPAMVQAVSGGQYMFQRGKAAVSFDRDGKALIHACQASDFSSFVHEMGHIWRQQLSGSDLAVLERWLAIKDHKWTTEHEEQFANGLEQYVKENVLPHPVLKGLFDRFKEWLKNIYQRFAQFLMPEDVKKVYEGLFLTSRERRVRELLGPPSEEEFGAIMGVLGETVAGGDIRGLGLNLAEMRSLYSRYGVKHAIPTISESATGVSGVSLVGGGDLRKAMGKEGDYLYKQYERNPVRWRRISREAQLQAIAGRLTEEDVADVEEVRRLEASWSEHKHDLDAVVKDVLGLGEEAMQQKPEGAYYVYDAQYKGKEPEPMSDGRVRIGPKYFQYSKAQQLRLLREALTSARREARMQTRLAEQAERTKAREKFAEHRQREKVSERIKALRQIKADIDANKLKVAPEYLQPVRELLARIDAVPKMKPAYRAYLEELRAFLKSNPNTELSEDAMDAIERLGEKNLRDMAANEVEALYQTVKHYLHLASDEKFINYLGKKADFEALRRKAVSELPALKSLGGSIVTSENKQPDLVKAGLDDAYQTFVGIEHDHYDLIVEKACGKNSVIDRLFGRAIEEARSKALAYLHKQVQEIQSTLEDLKIENPVEFWNTRETYGQLELSRAERVALYLHSLNEDNWDSLSQGGFGFRGKRGQGDRKFREGQDFLQGALKEHLQHMTSEEKVLAEAVRELHVVLGKDQAEVFLRVNGYELPLIDNHYFKDTMASARGSELEKQEILAKRQREWVRVGVPKGRLKARKGVVIPLYLNDVFYDLQRDISEAATYIAFEEPLRAASKLLYDGEFRQAFEQRVTKRAWRRIEEGLKDVIGELPAFNEFDKLLNKLRRNTTTAYVALGFPILKQGLTMLFGGAYVREDYLMRGLADTTMHRKRVFDLHRLYSPKFVERGESTGWRDIAEIQRATLAKRLAGGKDLRMLAMKPTRWVDMGVTAAIMQGAVLQVLDEFKSGHLSEQVSRALAMRDEQIAFRTADEKIALAYKYADYAIARLQDVAFPEHRSPWQRGGQLQRMTSTFGTSTNQIWNLLKRSALEARRYGTSASYKKLARVILAVFASALGEAAIDTLRDRLKKRPPRKYDFLWRALNSVAGNWFIIRDLWNAIQSRIRYGWGGDVSLGPLSVLNRGVDVAVDIKEVCSPGSPRRQRRAAYRLVNDVIDLTLILSGLPFYAPKKLLQGILEKAEVLP